MNILEDKELVAFFKARTNTEVSTLVNLYGADGKVYSNFAITKIEISYRWNSVVDLSRWDKSKTLTHPSTTYITEEAYQIHFTAREETTKIVTTFLWISDGRGIVIDEVRIVALQEIGLTK